MPTTNWILEAAEGRYLEALDLRTRGPGLHSARGSDDVQREDVMRFSNETDGLANFYRHHLRSAARSVESRMRGRCGGAKLVSVCSRAIRPPARRPLPGGTKLDR